MSCASTFASASERGRPGRRKALLALLGALGLAGCIAAVRLASGPPAFNHAEHLGFGLGCPDCHAGARSEAKAGMPAPPVCAGCHNAETDKPAVTAGVARYGEEYGAKRFPDASVAGPTYADVKFDHKAHAAAGIGCAQCHPGAEKGAAANPAGPMPMAECTKCHEERKAKTDCRTCHEKLDREEKPPSHVAGARDSAKKAPIEFKVMIHKIHDGEHLPSVNGVGTNANGTRNYSVTPTAYVISGFQNTPVDFSHVAFPMWPDLNIPMPRDGGYSLLSSANQATDTLIREGVTACNKCHGVTPGVGPQTPPAQGGLAFSEPTRRACGSCHDDVNFALPYTANGQTMDPQPNDSDCVTCHPVSQTATIGNSIAVTNAHTHPLLDPTFNPGLNIQLTSVTDTGTAIPNGKFETGEKVRLTFKISDDSGTNVLPASINVAMTGPTAFATDDGTSTNRQIVLLNSVTPSALGALASSYTLNLPELIMLEPLAGTSGAVTVARTPIVTATATTVFERTATGTATILAVAAKAMENWIDVADKSGFARDQYVVLDDGESNEEYLRIQYVDATLERLWFNSPATLGTYGPWLRFDHDSGASVTVVTLTARTDFTITNAAAGELTLGAAFTGGKVLVTYTTDFVIPPLYPPELDNSPDLTETWGKWSGLALVDGTYTVGIWVSKVVTLSLFGESNRYQSVSPPATEDVLLGSATEIVPYGLITSEATCDLCHNQLLFHGGGRRGFDTCALCHTLSGAEDRSQYVAANAPPTTGRAIDFRRMLHKIHMGEELEHASTYEIVGFGSSAYPNNFGTTTFEDVVFPALPDGVKDCRSCHGAQNTAWEEPGDRTYPGSTTPARVWMVVCGSCHDADDAQAHIQAMTPASGVESCPVCHGPDADFNVPLMHKVR